MSTNEFEGPVGPVGPGVPARNLGFPIEFGTTKAKTIVSIKTTLEIFLNTYAVYDESNTACPFKMR